MIVLRIDEPWRKRMANAGFFFLAVLVAVNPFPHTTALKEVCFYLALMLFCLLLLAGKAKLSPPTPMTLPVLLFTFIAFVGLWGALDRFNSLHDLAAHWLKYILLFLLFDGFAKEARQVRFLVISFVMGVFVFCGYGLLDFYILQGHPISERFLSGSKEMTINLVGISVLVAVHLIMSLIGGIRGKLPRFFLFGMIVLLAVVPLLTQTRSVLLVLILSLIFWAVVLRKCFFLFLPICIISVLILSPIKNRFQLDLVTTDIRLRHAALVAEVIRDYPLTGVGFGMQTFGEQVNLQQYRQKIETRYDIDYGQPEILPDPHNMYLDIAVRTGIPGLFAFGWMVFALGRMMLTAWRRGDPSGRIWVFGIGGALISFCTIGFFEPVFSHMQEFVLTLLIFLSSFFWLKADGRDSGLS